MRRASHSAALVAALSLVLAVGRAVAGEADEGIEARVSSAYGAVFLYYKGAPEEAVAAEEGDAVEAGDRVQTGDTGRVTLALDGDSLVELGPDADFSVDSLDSRAPSFTLSLGWLLAKVKSLAASHGRLEVRTPTAVAAVRGTEFGVEVGEDQATGVGVFDEGRVEVRDAANQGTEVLSPNQETSVAEGGRPAPAAKLKRFRAQRRRLVRLRATLKKVNARWQRLGKAQRVAQRRLARARANGAPAAKRARMRKHLEQIRKQRQQVQKRRAALRGRAQGLRKRMDTERKGAAPQR